MTTIKTAYPASEIQALDALRVYRLRLNPGDGAVTNLQITRGGPVVAGINVPTAELIAALDATANADVKHRADAYEEATRYQQDAIEWRNRTERAERDLARVRAELERTRETYQSELADAERCEREALEKATALAAERDRLLATIERIDAVRREFYEVRGDWSTKNGAWALKAQMEKAILGAPPADPDPEPEPDVAKDDDARYTGFLLWLASDIRAGKYDHVSVPTRDGHVLISDWLTAVALTTTFTEEADQ